MNTYKQLLAQREQLDAQIKQAESIEKQAAIKQAQQLISEFDLTSVELFSKHTPRNEVAAKYRDQETGATWTGRGREPLWIKGKDRDQFAIKEQA